MSDSLEIELGDDLYEVEVASFTDSKFSRRGHPDTWFEDPGELELGDVVKVWGLDFQVTGPGSGNGVPAVIDRISMDDFLKLYAEYEAIPLEKSRSHLEDRCWEMVQRQLEDAYDDRY